MPYEKAEDSNSKPYDTNIYFANIQDENELAAALIDRIDNYTNEMYRSGRLAMYKNAHLHYVQGFATRGFIGNAGGMGELTSTWINHYRNLIGHVLNLVTQDKIRWEPQVVDGTWDAMNQVKTSRSILNFYSDRSDIHVDGLLKDALEQMCVFGDVYMLCLWDKFLGQKVGDLNGFEIREGDISIKTYNPFDVMYDISMNNINEQEWICVRETVNKWDLIAKYPTQADKLREFNVSFNTFKKELVSYTTDVIDLVYVYRFLHKKTPACPKGKEVLFLTDDIVLENGDLEYSNWPAIRFAASEVFGTPFGYSKFLDLLSGQSAVDQLVSADLTALLTFAIPNVLLANDSGIHHSSLYGGLHAIKWDASKGAAYKPEVLNLANNGVAPATMNHVNFQIQNMGTLAGVNDAVKGDANTVIKGQASGAALAILTTNAINFNSDIQRAWVHGAEQLGTLIISNLADNAVTPREAVQKVGTRSFPIKYKGQDLKGINKVCVKIASPLLSTDAGKLQVIESFVQAGVGLSKQDLIGVIQDGSFDSAMEDIENQLMLIEDENERLMRGEDIPPADILEDHVLHIHKHRAKFSSVEAKKNQAAMNAFHKHDQSHIDMLVGGNVVNGQTMGPMNPVLAGILNQPVVPANSTAPTLQSPAQPSAPAKPGLPGGNKPAPKMPSPQLKGPVPPQGGQPNMPPMPQVPH